MIEYTFGARGHPKISARHRTTLEITRDGEVTELGDCIVATSSEVGLAGLPSELKEAARREGSVIALEITAGGLTERITGRGHPSLTFTSGREMVARRSGYICGRTLMIRADKSARDLDRRVVEALRKPETRVRVTITVF